MHSTTQIPGEALIIEHTERPVVCQDAALWRTWTPTQKAVMAHVQTVCGVKALGIAVGISHRQARRVVRQLTQMGALSITAHAKGGRGQRAAFQVHVPFTANEDTNADIPAVATPQNEDMGAAINEDIPDGVSHEAYTTATARLQALGLAWDAVTLITIAPLGTFVYLPNGDRISPFGELRIKTRTPAEIFAEEQQRRVAAINARVQAALANEDIQATAPAPSPVAPPAALGNQRARTHADVLDHLPIDTDLPPEIQSGSHVLTTKKDDTDLPQSISRRGDDRSPRARASGAKISDELVRAVEDAALIRGRREDIRRLLEEVGQDFRNCHWSIPTLVKNIRAEHFAKYPQSQQFGFTQLANWLHNKQRDARREQNRDLTPAHVYHQAS